MIGAGNPLAMLRRQAATNHDPPDADGREKPGTDGGDDESLACSGERVEDAEEEASSACQPRRDDEKAPRPSVHRGEAHPNPAHELKRDEDEEDDPRAHVQQRGQRVVTEAAVHPCGGSGTALDIGLDVAERGQERLADWINHRGQAADMRGSHHCGGETDGEKNDEDRPGDGRVSRNARATQARRGHCVQGS